VSEGSVRDDRRQRMRELTRRGHAGQTRNGGRLPYWVHTDAVADICDQALRRTGELPPDEAADLVLAAHGHDLYEDTGVTAATIRDQFSTRVDRWIDGMTNRKGDRDRADYMRRLASSDDETRVIKCADLIDNMLSVAYGLHDLGLGWAREFFLPIATETRDVLLSTPFTRLQATGAYLIGLVDWAWTRLEGSMETANAVAAGDNGAIETAPQPDTGDAMSDEEEEAELSPAARAMVERLSFTPEQWAESQAAVRAEELRKAKELFGDQKPFAIPDTETDS
jgi:hypothetical protein